MPDAPVGGASLNTIELVSPLTMSAGTSAKGTSAEADGDANIESSFTDDLKIPLCEICGGILKPNVVFFGDSVDKNLVEKAYHSVASADALIVIGTSLSIFSGYRFLRQAAKLKLPVLVINPGRFRGEELADIHLAQNADEVLSLMV